MLHIHHLLLLVSLLRSLMMHQRRSARPGARKSIRPWACGHLALKLRIHVPRSRRIHLHLRVGRHAHVRPVGRLIGHHLSSHGGGWGIYELRTTMSPSKRGMLDVRAHAISLHRHLRRIPRNRLRLRIVHIRRHGPRRRVHR
jgi:hypothetical protein